jgi:hypothetical protein
VAILSSGLTSWKMEPFPIAAPPFSKTSPAPRQAPAPSGTLVYAPTSYLPSSIKSHAWPRLSSCAIFPRSARWLVPAIKPCPWT